MAIQHGIENCPLCGASLDGGSIPIERRYLYDGADRYSILRYCYGSTDHDPEYLMCPKCSVYRVEI